MSSKQIFTCIGTLMMAGALVAPRAIPQSGDKRGDKAEVLLEGAQHKQLVDGDLDQAIQMYKKILSQYAKNRPVAAKALVEMGECYEKLGNDEASKAFERVLRDYADQSAEATEARARLAALEHGEAQGTEMVARRVWAGPEVDPEGAVTADGRYLTYPDWDTGDLAVHDLVTGENRRVTHKGSWSDSPDFAEFSIPSPNAKRIAYAWFNGTFYELRVIGFDGSAPRTLCRNPEVEYLEPKSWSPDGKEIVGTFFPKGKKAQIVTISVGDGSTRVLKTFNPRLAEGQNAMFSPDGRFIAYDFPSSEGSRARDVWIMSKDGDNDAPLVEHPADDYLLGWAPDGKSVIFARDRTGSYGIWAIDVAGGKPSGSPKLLKVDLGLAFPLGISQNRSLYYGLGTGVRDLYVASFDFSDGELLEAPALVSQFFTGRNAMGEWSPDGKYLAYLSQRQRNNVGSPWINDTIVIRSLETGQERELVPKLEYLNPIGGLCWSADGRSLYFVERDTKGGTGVFRIDAQTGNASILLKSTPEGTIGPVAELPGGNALVFLELAKKKNTTQLASQLVVRNLQSGEDRVLVPDPPGVTWSFAISPDGARAAFTTAAEPGGTSTLRVVPVAGGVDQILLRLKAPETLDGGGTLAWTRDGAYIVFAKGSTITKRQQGELWEINAQGGEPRNLGLSMARIRQISIHPDGHHIVFGAGSYSGEIWTVGNLLPALKAAK